MTAREHAGSPPALRFVAGSPTPEEVAAVTAVLLTHRREEQADAAVPGRRDQFRRMRLGLRLRPGRGAWRRSRPEE